MSDTLSALYLAPVANTKSSGMLTNEERKLQKLHDDLIWDRITIKEYNDATISKELR